MSVSGLLCVICLFCTESSLLAMSDSDMKSIAKYQNFDLVGQAQRAAKLLKKENTYIILEKFLTCYTRAFTMLDIRSNDGFYSLKAAQQFHDSVFVMIDGNDTQRHSIDDTLFEICLNSGLTNLLFLNRAVNADDLQRLSECEHFDVVLALNVLEQFGQNWLSVAESLLDMGDNLLVEVSKNCNDINLFLNARGASLLIEFQGSTLYSVKKEKTKLKRKHWMKPLTESSNAAFSIKSNYHEKKLLKDYKSQELDWIPGINLLTFKMYSGVYPIKGVIKKEIENKKFVSHTDWNVHNMVVCGCSLRMIDAADPRYPDRIAFYDQRKRKSIQFHHEVA